MLRTVDACGAHTDHDGQAWWTLLDARPWPKKRLAEQGNGCRTQWAYWPPRTGKKEAGVDAVDRGVSGGV
ncbi:hypothetical protein ACFCZQ_09545 [Streptomyces virginiae]|uniref:hypothetical protein n=1 Tax=Streptomyces virginiae TaxID=1961 RepID=UPI0035DC8C1A